MDLNDWILSLHLLSAFALVGAEVVFWLMIVALWGADSTSRVASFMRVSQVGTGMVAVGSLGTIVFGVWLAISLDRYQLWDGWVIAAIVLWAIAVEVGRRGGTGYGTAGMEAAGSPPPAPRRAPRWRRPSARRARSGSTPPAASWSS